RSGAQPGLDEVEKSVTRACWAPVQAITVTFTDSAIGLAWVPSKCRREPMMTVELTTGQRVARARRRIGWDQARLAAAVDRSVSWVSKVETGRLPLDRMSVVGQLAEVLGVEVIELTGQPYRHDSAELDSGHAIPPQDRNCGGDANGHH
ncbi:helix-turn-helix domain-containing protein, partial [Streptomyces sp. NPDC055722]